MTLLSTDTGNPARACAVVSLVALLALPTAAHAQPDDDATSPDDSAASESEGRGQILLIPLGGKLPEESAGVTAELTRVLADAIRATGAEPVTAGVDAADLEAIVGCSPVEVECFETVASMMEVNEVVFGTVAPHESGTGYQVALTSIRADQNAWQRRVRLRGQSKGDAATEFEPHATSFLLRKEPVKEPDLTVKQQEPPPPPPPIQPQPDTSKFSLRRVKPYSWALTGGGLLLVGAGVYMFAKAADKSDELDAARDQTVSDMERMKSIEDDGKRYTALGNGFLISGAAVAIAGIALGVRQAMQRPEQTPTAVTVEPVAVRGGAGLSVVFRGDL